MSDRASNTVLWVAGGILALIGLLLIGELLRAAAEDVTGLLRGF